MNARSCRTEPTFTTLRSLFLSLPYDDRLQCVSWLLEGPKVPTVLRARQVKRKRGRRRLWPHKSLAEDFNITCVEKDVILTSDLWRLIPQVNLPYSTSFQAPRFSPKKYLQDLGPHFLFYPFITPLSPHPPTTTTLNFYLQRRYFISSRTEAVLCMYFVLASPVILDIFCPYPLHF
jgi:hypothetical protein